MLGLLCWLQLTVRSTFAIWRNVYIFIREYRDKGETRIPELVLGEFQTYLYLMPLMSFSMNTPWLTDVYMMDSCMEGAGVIQTVASLDEIRAEAKYAETGAGPLCSRTAPRSSKTTTPSWKSWET